VKKGQFHAPDPKLVAHSITVMGHMWAFRRWFWKQHCTLEEYIQRQTLLVMGGVLARPHVAPPSAAGVGTTPLRQAN